MKLHNIKLVELNDPKSNPISEQVGLSADTEVMYVKSFKGNEVFRVVGSSDAVILYHNSYASSCGVFYTEAVLKKNYFDEQKRFGNEAAKVAVKYNLDWKLVVAIGSYGGSGRVDESVKQFETRIKKYATKQTVANVKYELMAGINRRKKAIKICLGYSDDEYEEAFWVEKLGQEYSEVIAKYILSLY